MDPTVGKKVIEIARGLIGSHYINGAYGAIPGGDSGFPCANPRPIKLVADPSRLDPNLGTPQKNLAVIAAELHIKTHCICAGSYASFPGGRVAQPTNPDLIAYLASLKDKPPATWPNFFTHFTPRRAYGPAQGGDLNGKLVWGQSCKGIRHFDCVGFISYCYWKASGNVVQLDIKIWRQPSPGKTVFNFKEEQDETGKIRPASPPASLMDGDIIIKADHHIAFVNAQGTIFEAADTHIGVQGIGRFQLSAPGKYTHLVRLATGPAAPALAWPLGWWKVWDGNTYYYFLGADGVAKSTKTAPSNARTPPKQANNVGRYSITPPNQLVITWNKVAGASTSCRETFYNAAPDCEQMNANSNLYGPLAATRLK